MMMDWGGRPELQVLTGRLVLGLESIDTSKARFGRLERDGKPSIWKTRTFRRDLDIRITSMSPGLQRLWVIRYSSWL